MLSAAPFKTAVTVSAILPILSVKLVESNFGGKPLACALVLTSFAPLTSTVFNKLLSFMLIGPLPVFTTLTNDLISESLAFCVVKLPLSPAAPCKTLPAVTKKLAIWAELDMI